MYATIVLNASLEEIIVFYYQPVRLKSDLLRCVSECNQEIYFPRHSLSLGFQRLKFLATTRRRERSTCSHSLARALLVQAHLSLSPRPQMLRLDPDVLLYILTLSDIYTIISLSQVNKFLHAITTTKHPWISVVRDLSSRWMIDHPAEILETFETEVIMAEVKRAICGPQTWSKRQKLPPMISRGRVPPRGKARTRLQLERSQRGYVTSVSFDFREPWGGVMSLLHQYGQHYDITLVEVNLFTGVSCELFHFRIGNPAWLRVHVCGDYVAWDTVANPTEAMSQKPVALVNWRSREFIIFDAPVNRPAFALFPGHFILAYPTSFGFSAATLHLFSISSLSHRWKPLDKFGFNTIIHPMRVESTTFNVTGSNDDDSTCINRQARLFIAESRLHSATYELVVLVVDHHSPKPRDPSLVDRIWSRISGNRDPPEKYGSPVQHCTPQRYRITPPAHPGFSFTELNDLFVIQLVFRRALL
ncbi:hypothetical protein B0H13DRAFT_2279331 [Mycena leptocephala]|nr:hypothetical protein B0H13DRAFT_2279331 [Mycena leptocephala]